jgi:glycosyltransferase involved in cell wall biosynthesis
LQMLPVDKLTMKKTVSVIMSAYNEEQTVGTVLERIRTLDFVTEIVVVDNGSQDSTHKKLEEAKKKDGRISILRIEKNRGLGCGLRLAIENTTGDIIVRQDADLEYDPDELIDLVEQIENGNAEVVYGSRMLVRKAHKVHYFYNYLANVFITIISNFCTNLFLSDVETAAKAFDGPILRSLQLKSKGFEIENEMTIKLKNKGCIFFEVPFSYYGRTYGEGKKIKPFDGVKAIYYILFYSIGGLFSSKKDSLR